LGKGGTGGNTFHIPNDSANHQSGAGKGKTKEGSAGGASELEKPTIKVTVTDLLLKTS